MTTIAIHQPGYLPWLGFFKKMMESDVFVYFDDVQFVKNNFYNRNLIRIATGSTWLTVPVIADAETKINQVKIDNTKNWAIKHKKSIIFNYSKAEHFAKFNNFINELYDKKFELLIDLNMEIIEFLKEQFNIKTKTVFSSELHVDRKGSDKVLEICKLLKADLYISGTFWAKDHLDLSSFYKHGIKVQFEEFQYPTYKQIRGQFIPKMASIDLLFNEGRQKSTEILQKCQTVKIDCSQFQTEKISKVKPVLLFDEPNTKPNETKNTKPNETKNTKPNETKNTKTTISIHQPGYLPWFGFFHKMMYCDIFVFLDDVQYEKNGWQNRNKIRTNNGIQWLTVPVKSKLGLNLNQIKIDNSQNWAIKHKKSIMLNYAKANHFKEFWSSFESIYDKKYDYLIDLNMDVIKQLIGILNIKTKTIFSSELEIKSQSSDRILDICKSLDADVYISGTLGANYLKLDDFKRNNIEVKFQNVYYPIFKQCFEPFMPNLSTLDLLFNEGKNTSSIIKNARVDWGQA